MLTLLTLSLLTQKEPPVWYDEETRLGPAYHLKCKGGGVSCVLSGTTLHVSIDGGAQASDLPRAACPAGQFVTAIDGGSVTCQTAVDAGVADNLAVLHPLTYWCAAQCNSTTGPLGPGISGGHACVHSGSGNAAAISGGVCMVTHNTGAVSGSSAMLGTNVARAMNGSTYGIYRALVRTRTDISGLRMWAGVGSAQFDTSSMRTATPAQTNAVTYVAFYSDGSGWSACYGVPSPEPTDDFCFGSAAIAANTTYLLEIYVLPGGAAWKVNGVTINTAYSWGTAAYWYMGAVVSNTAAVTESLDIAYVSFTPIAAY